MKISVLKQIDEEAVVIEIFNNVTEQEVTPKMLLLVAEGHVVQVEKEE